VPRRFIFLLLLAAPLSGCGPYRTVDVYDEKTGATRQCAVDANGQPVQCKDGFLNREALADRPLSYRDLPPPKSRRD
jgi:hypothetical protein